MQKNKRFYAKRKENDMDFTALVAGGVPLVVVIFGLVEFAKKFGLRGNWLTVFSMLLGVGLGIGYKISEGGVPVGFNNWFGVCIFSLALGLVASGIYDFANARTNKTGP
jgi:hypothetical protein